MDLPEAEELGVLQAGNEAQDAGLFAELHVVLKTDQIEALGAQILLAKLHDGPGTASGAWVLEAHGFHGAEAQGVAAAAGDFLDGEAGLEVARVVFGNVGGDGVGLEQLVHEMLVLIAVERAVQVVVGTVGGFAVARGPVGDAGVNGIGSHDGADAVVEVEAAASGEAADFLGEGAAGQRTAGDDPDGVVGEGSDLVAAQVYQRFGGNGVGDLLGEKAAVDGEGMSAGDAGLLGGLEEQRIEPAEFLFEEPWGGGFAFALERVAADEFGKAPGLVRRRGAHGAHFVEDARNTAAGDLPGGFGARQAAAGDVDGLGQG